MKKLLIILLIFPITASAAWYLPWTWNQNQDNQILEVVGAPYYTFQKSLLPSDDTENIGTSTSPWDIGFFNQICLSADCRTSWPVGGGGSGGYDFPSVLSWGNSTSTTLGFLQGFLSTASSTINASTTITGPLTASGGIYGNLTGTASLATALAGNGTNCSVGQYARGVDASGNAEDCTADVSGGAGNTFAYPFPSDATTTVIDFTNSLTATSLSQGFAYLGSGDKLQSIASSSINLSWFNNDGVFITDGNTGWDNTYGFTTFAYPFPSAATTTVIDFTNSFKTSGLSQGFGYVGSGGLFNTAASSSLFGFTPASNATNINTTYPLQGGGNLSADRTLTLAFGTTTSNTWASTQTFGNSSTTLASFGYASSTLWYGGGLTSCVGAANKVTYADGTFRCEGDETGVGGTVDGTGVANTLAMWTDSNTLQSTSSNPLYVGALAATTTATSTFVGDIKTYNNISAGIKSGFGLNNVGGIYSIVAGSENTSSGKNSIVVGESNTLYGIGGGNDDSAVFGKSNVVGGEGFYLFAAGQSNDLSLANDESFALGYNNTVQGTYAGALGANNDILKDYAGTMPDASFGIGDSNSVDCPNCMGLGWQNEVHDFGETGDAIAIGNHSFASSTRAKTFGSFLFANADDAMVFGKGVSSGSKLTNAQELSIYMGMDSTIPTFVITGSAGAGTIGKVGIGTTTPAWLTQISSVGTVKPFLALSDQSAATDAKHWTLSSQGGNLYVATSSDLYATSTLPALRLDSNGNLYIKDLISCTGDIETDANGMLSCGSDEQGVGGGGQDFTYSQTHWGQTTSATGTALWLQGSPFSLFASSTAQFNQASTTLLTVGDIYGSGAIDGALNIYGPQVYLQPTGVPTNYIWLTNNSATIQTDVGNIFSIDSSGTSYWQTAEGNYVSMDDTNNYLRFATNNGERARFNYRGAFGIGTTTPYFPVTIASSTAPQLTLSVGTGIPQWSFRNAGGNFYLSTTTIAGTATSTVDALYVNSDNIVRFGNNTATCIALTGSADLCDGGDASGGVGGSSAYEIATTSDIAVPQLAYFTKTAGLTTLGSVATTTLTATSPLSLSQAVVKVGGSNSVLTISTTTTNLFSGIGGQILTYNDGLGWLPFATTSIPLAGDVTGTLGVTVVGNNSHDHDATTISGLGTDDISGLDISADTNLAATWPIIKTDDTLSFGWSYPFPSAATSTLLTFSGGISTTNASSTLFSTGYASSTLYYGAGLTNCNTENMLTWTDGKFGCEADTTGAGGGGVGTLSTSTSPTIGNLAYWTSKDAWPETLGTVATTSLTINAPLTTSGTAGALVGGTNLTIDIDNIAAADLDLADITLSDFTNDAGFTTFAYPFPAAATSTFLTLSGGLRTANASTTILSAHWAKIGATASTTIDTAGNVSLPAAGTLTIPALTSALTKTDANGLFSEYGGASCTNQFVRSLDALGAATCATVGTADVSGLDISDDTNLAATWPIIKTDDTLSFGWTYPFPSAATTTLLTFSGGISTANASTTLLSANWLKVGGTASTTLTTDGLIYSAGTATSTFAGRLAVGTTTPLASGASTFSVKGLMSSVAQFWSSAGTKILEILDNGGVIANGAWNFGDATSVEIPNGTAPTVDATGEIAIDTTSDQLAFFGGTSKKVISPLRDLGFAYATSTWSATTTLRVGPAPANITVQYVYCETNTGTVGVSLYDGTNRADYIPTASSTINKNSYISNNSFTAGETIRVDAGTPASTPTALSCRFVYTYDSD